MSDGISNGAPEAERRAILLRNLATWEDNVAKGLYDRDRRRADCARLDDCLEMDIARRDQLREEVEQMLRPAPRNPRVAEFKSRFTGFDQGHVHVDPPLGSYPKPDPETGIYYENIRADHFADCALRDGQAAPQVCDCPESQREAALIAESETHHIGYPPMTDGSPAPDALRRPAATLVVGGYVALAEFMQRPGAVKHVADKCPVSYDTEVEVLTRGGRTERAPAYLFRDEDAYGEPSRNPHDNDGDWVESYTPGSYDIIAYRIISHPAPAPAETQKVEA